MERDLLALVWPVFAEEAREHLEALGAGILQLEQAEADRRPELARALKRTAHTLKGSAASVGLEGIERLAHRFEDLLAAPEPDGAFPRERIDEALAAVAGMESALAAVRRELEGGCNAAEFPAYPALASPRSSSAGGASGGVPGAAGEATAPGREAEAEPHGATAARPVADPRERTVRVPVEALDSLIRQVEAFARARAHQVRRVQALRATLERNEELIATLRRLASAERLRPEGDPAALDDAAGRLREIQRDLGKLGQETTADVERLRLVGHLLRDDLRDLRAAPASTVLEPLRRVAREVASRLGKEVELSIENGEARLDRRVLEELRDPLLHLVRNAVDHGIEAPEVRAAAGKPRHGRLRIAVEPAGRRVRVIVADDGPGLDLARLRATAVQRGLLAAGAAAALDDEEAMRLVFRPGFSTAERADEISGRGIGLDVVHTVVTRLQGAVDLDSTPGAGTRVILDLPPTLAAATGILVRAGGELLAVPAHGVERLLRVRPEALAPVGGRTTVDVAGTRLPYLVLARLLGIAGGALPPAGTRPRPALVLSHGAARIVAAVDEVIGQEELVLQPLGDAAASLPHLAGAAILEGRRLVPVLAVPEVIRAARPSAAQADAPKRRILCVDDSLTTRAAMKAVLELAGFEVIPAGDGEEALSILAHAEVALVVTDVQMPRLDGLGLIRRIRADGRLRSLPTILVTSLDGADDRAAGLEAGADAYLVKREVEGGRLLELVRQLLPE